MNRTPKSLVLTTMLSITLVALIAIPTSRGLPATASAQPKTYTAGEPSYAADWGPPAPRLRLRVATFDPLQHTIPAPQGLSRHLPTSQAALRLIQFRGPIQDSWYDEMVRSGLEIVTYVPDYAYLVWGTGYEVARAASRSSVRWTGDYLPIYALYPGLLDSIDATTDVAVVVQVYQHADVKSTVTLIQGEATRIVRAPSTLRNKTTLGIEIAAGKLAWLAKLPDVITVEPLLQPQPLDEIQGQLVAGQVTVDGVQPSGPGYLHWLTATVGLTTTAAAYPIVDITDDGIDDGDATPRHPDFYELGDTNLPDRLIYNYNWTQDPAADGGGGHGNLNASIVGGYNALTGYPYEDGGGYNYGLGISPFGRIAGSKVFGNTSGWSAPGYSVLVANAYALGARIISNSWGGQPGTGEYLVDDQTYDALVRDADPLTPGEQPVTIIFSAGNSGPNGGTTGSPANAKNVISVGASENYRPTWTDGCGFGPSAANNANDIASFSSRGPTVDGRIKPELVAPGTHIQGTASQSPSYTGAYVCDKYHPVGQTLYAASSGTSHSAPAVAGAASLLFRFYQDHYAGSPPSPAMVKAYLVNAARYLDGVGSGDTLPSYQQGYGALDLGSAFEDVPRIVQDQEAILHSTGESVVLGGSIAQSDVPFRVTLAWTDAPGPTTAAPYVNNLDLVVTVGGQTYRGNSFSGATSIPGGSADARNNVESVFLPAGLQGPFAITVEGTNLAGDGVPGNGDPTDQDFALVCTNCQRSAGFAFQVTPTTQAVCRPSSATYTVSTTAFAGYAEEIGLQTDGQPAGAAVAFTPNPVVAGTESTLTIDPAEQAAPGNYLIDVTGTSPTQIQTVTVGLDLFVSAPGTPGPVSPIDGAENVSLRPTLSWASVPQAQHYTVEVATEPTFSHLVYTATTKTVSHTLAQALPEDRLYYWRVIAENVCGPSTASEAQSFTTQPNAFPLCSEPHLGIPDANAVGITDLLQVPADGTLLDLSVAISVTHSWVGDLVISLEQMSTGKTVTLLDRPGLPPDAFGCSGSNLAITFDDEATFAAEDSCQNATPAYPLGGTFRPNEPLSRFAATAMGGEWQLHVADLATSDVGSLDGWCLIPVVQPVPAVAFSSAIYTAAMAPAVVPISVTLSRPTALTVTVDYAAVDGGGIAGFGYVATHGTLTFPPGTLGQQFGVSITGIPLTATQTITLSLSNPVHAALGQPNLATLKLRALPYRLYLPVYNIAADWSTGP